MGLVPRGLFCERCCGCCGDHGSGAGERQKVVRASLALVRDEESLGPPTVLQKLAIS